MIKRTRLLVVGFAVGSMLALGCSSKAPTPAPAAPKEPPPPTASAELGKVSADKSLTDEQSLKKMGQILTERAKELNVLEPTGEGARLEQNDEGWLLEMDLLDVQAPLGLASPQQAAVLVARTAKLTKSILLGELIDLLEAGGKRHLTAVRASVFTRVKKRDGEPEQVLAFRVLATVADAKKLVIYRFWPLDVPPGEPRDEAARSKLESEMWTVEADEYANLYPG